MRWLLVLGAEARFEDTFDAAEAMLLDLGDVARLTAVRLTEASDGSPRRFRNCLLMLRCALPREALREALKRIERTLGRGEADGMPIDIDMLACAGDDDSWRPDPHAVAKGEFMAAHVRVLLDEAGVHGLVAR